MELRDLQPGDVLNSVVDHRVLVHSPIVLATDSPFPHSAMFEDGLISIGALIDGVQRRELAQWDRFLLVTRHPEQAAALAALECMRSLIGRPYDILGLVPDLVEELTVEDLPDKQGVGVKCSTAIALAFELAGWPITGLATEDVTPRDLVENSVLEVVGFIRIR
jgi:hypothetical protein